MTAVVVYSLYVSVALVAALVLIFGLAGAVELGGRVKREPLPWVFFVIVIAMMAIPLITGRVFSSGLNSSDATIEDIGDSFWGSRILTLLVLAFCTERVVRYFLRPRERLQGWPVFWAFVAFAFASQLANGAFGAHRSFDHKSLYAFLLYFAFFIVSQQDADRCFRFARGALLLFLIGSAVAIAFRSNAVIEQGYGEGLPGLNFRYHGLATHANTMGPMAVAFLVTLWRYPIRNFWVNASAWMLGAGSLVLSQSKTSLFTACAIWLFLEFYRRYRNASAKQPGAAIQFVLVAWIGVCIVAAALALGVLVGANYLDWGMGKLDSITTGQWASLSGRTRIWALAWHEFMSHPLFGYGPTIWDPLYRMQAQMPFALHAHNQLMQSLSSAGLFGGITLLWYAGTLTVVAFRACERTGGISIALLGLMFVRSISEVPFSTGGVMQAEFIVHLLVMIACVGAFQKRELPARQHAAGPTTRPRRMSHMTSRLSEERR